MSLAHQRGAMYSMPNAMEPAPAHDGLIEDARTLISAAQHLRWLSWYRLVTSVGLILLVLALHGRRLNPLQLAVILLVMTVVWIGFALAGFALAYFVRRAHLWAVILALIMSIFSLLFSALSLFQISPGQIPRVVVETAFLIFGLSLVKQLIQSLGAAQRVQNSVRPPLQALPGDD